MNHNVRTLLHLSLISGVGPARILAILRALYGASEDHYYHGGENVDLRQIYSYVLHDFIKMGLSSQIAQLIIDGLRDMRMLDEECARIERYNISLHTLFDVAYPANLRRIYLPPIVLYSLGKPLVDDRPSIAIVGSRLAGTYAQDVVDALVPPLVAANWRIVSGGALGVDTMAHRAAHDAGGSTIVVLGSGLLAPYPAQNKDLFRTLMRNDGTLLSPFPLMTMALRGNFPARNRIIAGLSQGCILVQAAVQSGARITAQFALDQGKQVFAVPGSIFDPLSLGCHELIAQGAKLVNNVDDILSEFGQVVTQATLLAVTESATTQSSDRSKKSQARRASSVKAHELPEREESVEENLNPIIAALTFPMSVDVLSMQIGISPVELQDQLFMLQLEGKVRQNFAGSWERSHV